MRQTFSNGSTFVYDYNVWNVSNEIAIWII